MADGLELPTIRSEPEDILRTRHDDDAGKRKSSGEGRFSGTVNDGCNVSSHPLRASRLQPQPCESYVPFHHLDFVMIYARRAAMGEHDDSCDLLAGADGLQQML